MRKLLQILLRFFNKNFQPDREGFQPPPLVTEEPVVLPPQPKKERFILDRRTHKLHGIRYVEDPGFGFEMQPKGIVIHFTCSYNLEDTVSYFKDNAVDIHLLVGKSGEVVQMVPFNKSAAHAGKSSWRGFSSLNNHFIGIEVLCIGQLKKVADKYFDFYEREHKGAVHECDVLGHKYWEPFTKEQISSLVDLCVLLCREYSIPTSLICGHHECSPGRKVDPGGSLTMPMDDFRKLVSEKL